MQERIDQVQRMRDEAQAYVDTYDVPGEWLDGDGAWKDWESEAEAREAQAAVDTLDRVLAVLRTS